jgi:hypothetical protein
LIQIRGQIARKLKFFGQLGVKLKKFTVNDVSVKVPTYRGLIDKNRGAKLKKLKV